MDGMEPNPPLRASRSDVGASRKGNVVHLPGGSRARPAAGPRLDLKSWESLAEIAALEGKSVARLLHELALPGAADADEAVKEFAVAYFRERAMRRLNG